MHMGFGKGRQHGFTLQICHLGIGGDASQFFHAAERGKISVPHQKCLCPGPVGIHRNNIAIVKYLFHAISPFCHKLYLKNST